MIQYNNFGEWFICIHQYLFDADQSQPSYANHSIIIWLDNLHSSTSLDIFKYRVLVSLLKWQRIFLVKIHYPGSWFSQLCKFFISPWFSNFAEKDLPPGFPKILEGPAKQSVEKGRTASLQCRAMGTSPMNIVWIKDLLPVLPSERIEFSVQSGVNGGNRKFCGVA